MSPAVSTLPKISVGHHASILASESLIDLDDDDLLSESLNDLDDDLQSFAITFSTFSAGARTASRYSMGNAGEALYQKGILCKHLVKC